jgi:hypothetical protein
VTIDVEAEETIDAAMTVDQDVTTEAQEGMIDLETTVLEKKDQLVKTVQETKTLLEEIPDTTEAEITKTKIPKIKLQTMKEMVF